MWEASRIGARAVSNARVALRGVLLLLLVMSLAAGCGDEKKSPSGVDGGQDNAGGAATGGEGESEGGKLAGKGGSTPIGVGGAESEGGAPTGHGGDTSVQGETLVRATVRDLDGRPLADVQVENVDTAATSKSNADGLVAIRVNADNPSTLRFSLEGYTDQFKVLSIGAEGSVASLHVELLQRQPARKLPNVEAGGAAASRHGARLELPAQALVNADGDEVTGEIDVTITPVNVASVELGAFPGLFMGVDENQTLPIASYGTVEFQLTQDGEPLQLAKDKEATLELPIYVKFHPDGKRIAVDDSVPVWSLNEQTGVWRREGSGRVVRSTRSPTGLALRATVKHLSWWNCDIAVKTVDLTARCSVNEDDYEVPPGTECTLTGETLNSESPRGMAIETIGFEELSDPLQLPDNQEILLEACAWVLRKSDGELVEACGNQRLTTDGDDIELVIELDLPEALDIELIKPSENLETDGTVEFEARAQGDVSAVELIARDDFDADGLPFVLQRWLKPPYKFSWDTLTVKQGFYTVAAVAYRGQRRVTSANTPIIQVERDLPPPIARFAFSVAVDSPLFGFDFDPGASETQGTALEKFFWDFGDGDQALQTSQEVVRHRFTAPGTYSVSLMVEDGDGKQNTVTRELTVRERDPLGEIQVEQTGGPLEERQQLRFEATVLAAGNVTYAVRYAANHPIEALRGRCLFGVNECVKVVPAGQKFVFFYTPDSPRSPSRGRAEAAFDAYEDPITITAATESGFSERTLTLDVPALPSLSLNQAATLPCFEDPTLRSVDAPNAWFGLELEPSVRVESQLSVLDPETQSLTEFPRVSLEANQTKLSPARGRGAQSIVEFQCLRAADTEFTLFAKQVTPAGELPLGEMKRILPTEAGLLYTITGVPAQPPGLLNGRARVTVGSRENEQFGMDDELFDAQGRHAIGMPNFSVWGFRSTSLDVSPPLSDFAALFVNDGAHAETDVIVEMPAAIQTLDLGKTLTTTLNLGFIPAPVALTAPPDNWVLVTNDLAAEMLEMQNFWQFVSTTPNRSFRLGFSTEDTHTLQVSLGNQAQELLANGKQVVLKTSLPKQRIVDGAHLTGTLAHGGQEYAHLFDFDAQQGDKVQLVLSAVTAQTDYYIVSPTSSVLLKCGSTSTCAEKQATLRDSGVHALLIGLVQEAASEAYDFTFEVNP